MVLAVCCVVAFFALVLGLSLWGAMQEKRRQRAMEIAATAAGLTYLASDDNQTRRYSHLDTFSRGSDKRATNVMSGTVGQAEITAFDYRFTTSGSRSKSVNLQTVCILRASDLDLPHFTLRREVALVDRLVEAIEGADIDFEEDTAFSRKLVLRGESPEAIRAFFTADLRSHFLGYLDTTYTFEGRDNLLVVNCAALVKPAKLRDLLQRVGETVGLLRFASHARTR